MAVVRKARPDEEEQVRSLVSDAELPLDGLGDAWLIVVAEDDQQALVGSAALERHGTPDDRAYLLRSIAVRPDQRGQGIGGRLVSTVLDAADRDASGVATVGLLTETAFGYFGRFGFHPVPRSGLPAVLTASAELRGACPDSARAFLRMQNETG